MSLRLPTLSLGALFHACLFSAVVATAQPLEVPAFDDSFLGLAIQSDRLGVVLDISESMKGELPALRDALKKQLPRTPVVHVDGCKIEKPEPRAQMINGVAPDPVTAVATLGELAKVDAVLWLCDMGDPPNKYGIESMAQTLSEHGIKLFLLSVTNKPGPSVRDLAIDSDGDWKLIEIKKR